MSTPANTLTDAVLANDPYAALNTLVSDGWMAEHAPEILALADTATGRNGQRLHKDNLDHSFKVCAQTPPRLVVRLAGLLHDIGKPSCRQVGKTVSFHGHETAGGKIARRLLRRLGYPADITAAVSELVVLSGRTYGFADHWTDSAVRRILTQSGPLFDDLLDLSRADCTSRYAHKRAAAANKVDAFAAAAEAIRDKDQAATIRPAIDGNRIAELVGGPGPLVGVIWRALRDRAAAGEQLDASEAEQIALAIAAAQ